MTFTFIFAQVLGFLGIIVNLLSLQFNKHFTILLLKTIGTLFFVIQYVFLKAYVGMIMDVIGIIRNIVFSELVKKDIKTKPFIILFSLIVAISGIVTIILTWEESILSIANTWNFSIKLATFFAVAISVISIISKTLSTVSFGFNSPHIIRITNIPAATGWLIYNVVKLSITGIINEVFSITSSIVGEIRFKKNKDL